MPHSWPITLNASSSLRWTSNPVVMSTSQMDMNHALPEQINPENHFIIIEYINPQGSDQNPLHHGVYMNHLFCP